MELKDQASRPRPDACCVSIEIRNERTGEVVSVGGKNLTTNGYYEQLAYLLSGAVTFRSIKYIEFGKGTGIASETDVAVTHLTPSILRVEVATTNPTTRSATFTGTLISDEARDDDITEVGLLYENGTLAARYTFPAMKKSAGWVWTIAWTIQYSN